MSMPNGEPGSAGQDPNAQSGAGAPGTDPNAGTVAQSGTGTDATGQTDQTPTKTPQQLQAELESTLRRMQAADQNNSRLQAELKKLQDAQLSETERLKRDHEESQAKIAKLEEENKQLRLQNAFVADNTYSWHDPMAALKLADLSTVDIDASGKVTGLKEALKAVADTHQWMLKPKDGEAPQQIDTRRTPPGATGVGGTGGSKGGSDAATLEKKFPALRGRVS